MATEYSLSELMAVAVGREIKEGEVAFIGTGLPMLGAMLAKKLHAPNSVLIYESGAIDAHPKRTPISIGDPCLVPGASMIAGLAEVFGLMLQPGFVDVGFIGAAQIDKHGNLNTTAIGDYFKPKARLPGSGGANDIASLAKRTCIMMAQDKRKFVEKIDYCTSPGYLTGKGAREEVGLPRGGPHRVITNLGIYGFDENCEMYLISRHPNVSVEQIKENVSWDLKIPKDVAVTKEPTEEELKLLREEFDPKRIFLGGRD